MRASSVRPFSITKALSVPIRVLFPPARMNAVTSATDVVMRRSYTARIFRPKTSKIDRNLLKTSSHQEHSLQLIPSTQLAPALRSLVHESNLPENRGGSSNEINRLKRSKVAKQRRS